MNNRIETKNKRFFLLLALITLFSCNDFLEEKYDRRLVVPESLRDMRALLDGTVYFNEAMPNIGELSSGDMYTTYERWQTLPAPDRTIYTWADDVFENAYTIEDWNRSYERIYYSNVVLEGLEKIKNDVTDETEYKATWGAALFLRSRSFFQLMQIFAEQYHPTTASTSLGIPVRLESDINKSVPRATVQEVYDQMLNDLKRSIDYLRAYEVVKTRPTKVAAHALLAKVYLQMGDYENAGYHADECLSFNTVLLDFNNQDLSARYPFAQLNDEVIFHSIMIASHLFTPTILNVDKDLLEKYETEDLRKKGFFYDNKGIITFKGSYNANFVFFNGLTTAEILLIRAECAARTADIKQGLIDLNNLREKRIEARYFVRLSTHDKEELLGWVLEERRKELLFRGVRWSDIRRFNAFDNANISLKRELDGQIFELNAGSNKFIFPIPDDVIKLGDLQQNPERR